MKHQLSNQFIASQVAGRLAVFSTLAACCALLVEYILISQGFVDYFGFVGFLLVTALVLWSCFYTFAKKYHLQWHEQMAQQNKDLQLQALFSTLNPWPVLRFDRYGQLISKNSCAKTFFYVLKSDSSSQRSVFDFFPEMTKDAWQAIIQEEGQYEFEQNRSGFWLCFYFRAHRELGVINVYGFDVTQYKRQQHKAVSDIKRSENKVQRNNQLLSDAFQALHGPSKVIHHALATDLAIADPLLRHNLQLVVGSVGQLEALTSFDVQSYRQHSDSFDSRFLFETLVNTMAKQVFSFGTTLILDCDLASCDYIIADSRRMHQVVEAMLRFAVERSIGELVLMKVTYRKPAAPIASSTSVEGKKNRDSSMILRISIHDSGPYELHVVRLLTQQPDSIEACSDLEPESVHDLNLRLISMIAPLVGAEIAVNGSSLGGHNICFDWPVSASVDHQVLDRSTQLAPLKIHVFDPIELSAATTTKVLSRVGACVQYSVSQADLIQNIQTQKPDLLIYSVQNSHAISHCYFEELRHSFDESMPIYLLEGVGSTSTQAQLAHWEIDAVLTQPICLEDCIQSILQLLAHEKNAVNNNHVQGQQ